MTKFFTWLNFALVLALGGLCAHQWAQEKNYGERVVQLQKVSDAEAEKLRVQQDDLRRAQEDLDGFKSSVASLTTQSQDQLKQIREQKAQLFALENDRRRLSTELANWQHAVEEHKAAIVVRDHNIQTLLAQREQLASANRDAASKANEAIVAYNDLAKKYDDVVGRYNALATQYKTERDASASKSQ